MAIVYLVTIVVLLVLAWILTLLQFIFENISNLAYSVRMTESTILTLDEATRRRDYNTKHREGKIRRLMTSYHKAQDEKINAIMEKLSSMEESTVNNFKEIDKKCQTIKNVAGECRNSLKVVKPDVAVIKKEQEKSNKVSSKLELILDKTKKRS